MSTLFAHDPLESPGEDGRAWHYLRVAIERGLDRIDGQRDAGLTYKSAEPVPIGRRVEVPLGRGGGGGGGAKGGGVRTAGIVIETGGPEILGDFPASRVKAIALDTGAGLPPRLVELAKWMAAYYVCPLGMVLSTMLPAAVKKRTGLRTRSYLARGDEASEAAALERAGTLPPSAKKVWDGVVAIERADFPLAPPALAARLGERTLAGINRLLRLGLLNRIVREEVEEFGYVPVGRQGQLEQGGGVAGASAGKPTLTPQQSVVIDGVSAALGGFGVHLLRGVTGSGKTEVYLRVIERVLERGDSALVLVPEISLTPQTSARFLERFAGVGVAVLHSGLSASQRHRQWALAAEGRARVVVGARSAVFAPLDRLGVVVVDEEHASDYKQDQLPRYHGRDVAIKRAHLESCPVLLGSATPSLESWHNATRDTGGASGAGGVGKYALWELTERVGGGRLPPVEVVDMADERRVRAQIYGRTGRAGDARFHLLGLTLEKAIDRTLREGGQVILLLNRRGYACHIACPDPQCGWVLRCEDCDVAMVHHRMLGRLARGPDGCDDGAAVHGGVGGEGSVLTIPRRAIVRCHHCLAQRLLPAKCPVCEKGLVTLGLGTQRVEEEIARKFWRHLGAEADPATADDPRRWRTPPGMLRVDGDTMHSARDYFSALSRFATGDLRLLLGTQMIAKGLDFPNVRLVGVINADTALGLPDFRACERTFQLVSQVAGRAGRGAVAGRVIVQTMEPATPAIRLAAAHDYVGFATQELEVRRHCGLPPMSRMARVVLRDHSLAKAQAAAETLAAAIKEAIEAVAPGRVRVLGPMPAPIARIAAQHRIAIELSSAKRTALQEVLATVRAKGLLKSDAHTAVDIDPVALM